MNSDVLNTIEHACWAFGTLAGVIAAWFKLRSNWLAKQEDREALQKKYRDHWQMLRKRRYLELPERGVRWLLQFKSKPNEWSRTFLDKIGNSLQLKNNDYILYTLVFVPGAVSIWTHYGMAFGIAASVISLILIVIVGGEFFPDAGWILNIILFIASTYILISSIVVLQLALSIEIYWTALILLVILPIYALVVTLAIVWFPILVDELFSTNLEPKEKIAMNFGFAFSLSFFITAAALLIGSLAVTNTYIPQTLQMFLVNVLCDGITLLLTYIILSGAVNSVIGKVEHRAIKRKYPIPIAIILDIFVAALLACISLYLGLLGSDNALSIKETVYVLIARAPSGTTYELGPYFWVMHTTFIPTILYLTVIVLAYIGKLIILPVFHVLKKGHELEKPHDLTAAVFAFVAVLFLAIAGLLNRITPEQVTPI